MHKKLLRLLQKKAALPFKILVVRNDGLGDFITTLALVSSLKKQLPMAKIYMLVNQNIAPLEAILPDLDGFLIDEGILLKRHKNIFSPQEQKTKFKQLLNEIKAHHFSMAILPYAESKSAKLIHQAKIPLRLGSMRRSFFWRFNLHNKQTRKNSDSSEYQLNLNYLSLLGLKNEFHTVTTQMVEEKLPRSFIIKDFAIMHPYKRSQTALTWPLPNFQQLALQLPKQKFLVIGDPIDEEVLQKNFGHIKNCQVVCHLSLVQLSAYMRQAKFFIGNSSGPLHLAALCNLNHLGFFPKDKVSSKTRWQTLPQAKVSILLQPQNDMSCQTCAGSSCSFYNCLEQIEVGSVKKILIEQFNSNF